MSKSTQTHTKIELSRLKYNPQNPRKINDDKLKKLVKSIKEFPEMMAKRPIVCVTDKEDGLLIPLGGNMRLRALKELKLSEIPNSWVVLADDWTEEQRKEFIIKDNVAFGEWDAELLNMDFAPELLADWGWDAMCFDLDSEVPAIEPIQDQQDTVCVCPQCGEMFDYTKHKKTGAKQVQNAIS